MPQSGRKLVHGAFDLFQHPTAEEPVDDHQRTHQPDEGKPQGKPLGALHLLQRAQQSADGLHRLGGFAEAQLLHGFAELLGDGSRYGVKLSYAVQPSPDGLAQAFLIGEEFIGDDRVAMVLGDNIFHGQGLKKRLRAAAAKETGATVFGYYVDDPERFGIVEFDKDGKVISVEEKPKNPKSNYCITGLYFYDKRVVEYAKTIKPSGRGELEITDLNRIYLEEGDLNVKLLGRGFAWLDTGTMDSLLEASDFVQMIQKRQGIEISAPEEIAYLNGWISEETLLEAAAAYGKSPYGEHLRRVAEGKIQY